MKFAFALALLSSAPLVSQAAMVQFQYKSTVKYDVPSDNIAAGDDLFITISLDNGGGIENGVWGAGDVESISYQVGAGAGSYSYTFDFTTTNMFWYYTDGQFSTDGSGNLVSVPFEWCAEAPNSDHFWLNGYNHMFEAGGVSLSDAQVERNNTVAGWTAAGGVPVPEPSAALLGSLGALAMLRRRRR